MSKKKTSTKSEAAKVEKLKEEVKPEVVKQVDKQNEAENPSPKQSSTESDVNVPQEKDSASEVLKEGDYAKGQQGDVGEAGPSYTDLGLDPNQETDLNDSQKEQLEQDETEANNKEQLENLNKLKAVAFNGFRDTQFKKLDKKIILEDLSDLSKVPAEINYNSEILMSNGQIYTILDGLTAKFNKEALNNLK